MDWNVEYINQWDLEKKNSNSTYPGTAIYCYWSGHPSELVKLCIE